MIAHMPIEKKWGTPQLVAPYLELCVQTKECLVLIFIPNKNEPTMDPAAQRSSSPLQATKGETAVWIPRLTQTCQNNF